MMAPTWLDRRQRGTACICFTPIMTVMMPKNPLRTLLALPLASFCAGAFAAPGLAQTAGQLVAPTYAPSVTPAPGGGLNLPASNGIEAPAGAEDLYVTPSGLDIEGGLPALAAETAEIEAQFTDKRVSAADLFAAANALEAAYARAGYILVRVSLPPQTIEDGQELRLVVTDGYVDQVTYASLPPNVQKRVGRVTAPLVGRKSLTKAELERRLLLAGDTPGLDMKSALSPGKLPAATTLTLSGRYNPVTGYFGVNNDMTEALGDYSISAGVNFNDLLGLGEVGYLRLGGWPGFADNNILDDYPKNRQFVAGFTLPIGIEGNWLNVEGVDSKSLSDNDQPYDTPDHFQRLSINYGYDWLRSRSVNATTIVSYDLIDEAQRFQLPDFDVALSSDRLRVLRLTQTIDAQTEHGARFSGNATLSAGLNAFGARESSDDLPMSRDGAQPDFRKLVAEGNYAQTFNDLFVFSLSLIGQTSFGDPLPASEQLSLGGARWVSAFAAGELEADTGAGLRAEVASPTTFRPFVSTSGVAFAASPYLFVAGSVSQLENATLLEEPVIRAGAFGIGLKLVAAENDSPYSGNLTIEYAHGGKSSGNPENRINVSFLSRF
ncbi:ShlB/FhaC/HecB family hemolysin secretion/activation protein [Martelella alba]|uniref:ShlB/FhaC/HecB family hemolysin secretion/activation protein n=2 Tax=Martelella alba TaxID=2590451 RepID=A0A506U3T9_9HYPH|nr:ShlB/FhaC/HecB family hemolysin secretion/activation protein [Martelella alba]